MEKYGVKRQVLHTDLRMEEASLMRQMQAALADPEKTASDKSRIESRLQEIRHKLTELDLEKSPMNSVKD